MSIHDHPGCGHRGESTGDSSRSGLATTPRTSRSPRLSPSKELETARCCTRLLSNPAPNGCTGTLCGGAASNIILVAANNVTVENMTLDGANPALAGSGVLVNGAHINARNGIIDDWLVGDFTNLTVSNVIVQDIYLRGIEVTYDNVPGQTFTLRTARSPMCKRTRVPSRCSTSGIRVPWSNNTVTDANDAISANWSTGTQFLDNRISHFGERHPHRQQRRLRRCRRRDPGQYGARL